MTSPLKSFPLLLLLLLLSACRPGAGAGPTPTRLPPSTVPPPPTPTSRPDPFSDLPDESRAATRAGDPRPPAYWAVWNACAPENRATQAAANGGRAAGFVLMDDLLSYPGVTLGDFRVADCEQGLALLQLHTPQGQASGDPLTTLAAELLAAELNLNVGSETCPIAEEAVIGGHLVLSESGFDASGAYTQALTGEIAQAVPRLVELLGGYNRGELCR